LEPLTVPHTSRRAPVWIFAIGGFLLGVLTLWQIQSHSGTGAPAAVPSARVNAGVKGSQSGETINIYAHNLRLHQGPNFRVYVQWLRGQLKASRAGISPSLDDPESFYLNVTNGVVRANMGDISNYLNSHSANAPFSDIKMSGTGDQVTITGKLHKGITLPVELKGVLKVASNNRIQVQMSKIDVLKIPLKGLLGGFHVTLASLLPAEQMPGVEVEGNTLYFDSNRLLPPPHIRGTLTGVSIANPDLIAVYGDVAKDEERVGQWRNFLRLNGGTLNFGKLTMRAADLMMVDISQDAWFDLDLAHYQEQLVNGYSRITPDQELQIFMPDVSEIKSKQISTISIEWFKNRNVPPPPSVVPRKP